MYQTFVYCDEIVRKRERRKTRTPHIKDGSNDPVEHDDSEANVSCGPPRDGKRRNDVRDLTPVECEDTHGHAVCDAEQLIDHTIVGGHPTDPGETRERCKEIGRQEVYDNNQSVSKGKPFQDKNADCIRCSRLKHM